MICYVDMDGVLVDHVGDVIDHHHLDREKILTNWPKGVCEISKALGMEEEYCLRHWKHAETWANMTPTSDHREILQILEQFFGSKNIFICSVPYKEDPSAHGKLAWIRKFLPARYLRQYVLTPHKHLLSMPHTFLLDDHDENVQKFNGGNGGRAMLWNRPWNSGGLSLIVENLKALENFLTQGQHKPNKMIVEFRSQH